MADQPRLENGIRSHLDEWLDCYCLIGYDNAWNLITVQRADSDMHINAVEKAYADWYESMFDEKEEWNED